MRVDQWAERPTPLARLAWAHCRGSAWPVLLLVTVLSLATVNPTAAQNVPPQGVRMSFVADHSELTVGDVVTLSLVIVHPTDHVVVVPRLEREWGPFEVQDQTAVQTISVDGGVRTVAKQVRVTLFQTGDFETPSLPVTVRSPDGSVEQTEPHPVRLTVNSVLSGSDDQLKDLRPPADLSTSFWDRPAVFVIGGLIIVGLLGTSGYYLYRRSRSLDASVSPEVDTRSPWEVAMQELDRIARLDLPAGGDLKQHYTLMADALRICLGATFIEGEGRATAADMSTEEIETTVRRSSLDPGSSRAIIGLLQEADLVKFANYEPPAARAYEAALEARAMVESMRLSLQQRTAVATPAGGAGTP